MLRGAVRCRMCETTADKKEFAGKQSRHDSPWLFGATAGVFLQFAVSLFFSCYFCSCYCCRLTHCRVGGGVSNVGRKARPCEFTQPAQLPQCTPALMVRPQSPMAPSLHLGRRLTRLCGRLGSACRRLGGRLGGLDACVEQLVRLLQPLQPRPLVPAHARQHCISAPMHGTCSAHASTPHARVHAPQKHARMQSNCSSSPASAAATQHTQRACCRARSSLHECVGVSACILPVIWHEPQHRRRGHVWQHRRGLQLPQLLAAKGLVIDTA